MASLFIVPAEQVFDANGDPISGAKLNAYESGTLTRKDTFSDSGLTTANANPVVADADGRFIPIYIESGDYRFVLTDAADVEIWDADPVSGSAGASGAVEDVSASQNVEIDDATKVFAVDASGGAVTITLLAAATAGDGFEITVKKTDTSVNLVTIDGNGAETIDGATTLVLSAKDQSVTLRCDAGEWHVVSSYAMSAGIVTWRKGADIASASPLVLGTDGNYFDVTGTTGFSAITVAAGTLFMLQFDAALTLTHGASLDLPGEANITTAAGDRLIGFAEAANTVQVLSYFRADGQPLATKSGGVVQVVNTQDGAVATGTTALPADDTIPQNDEGDEYLELAITPTDAGNTLLIDVVLCYTHSVDTAIAVALFQDATAAALAAVANNLGAAGAAEVAAFRHTMTAGTTSETTFKVRAGGNTGSTMTVNGASSARLYGGVIASSITITEIAA
jgi:hypothetical protein